jgi:predicted negative regulator of RcsB-dependent stress response
MWATFEKLPQVNCHPVDRNSRNLLSERIGNVQVRNKKVDKCIDNFILRKMLTLLQNAP